MAKSNLYAYENKFELITDGGATVTEISEPIKWDEQESVLLRDIKWHGVNFEFTDAEVPLEFDCKAGRDLLNSLYESEGNDAVAFLRFSSFIDGVWEAMPDFKIDFNFWDDDFTKLSFTLKRTSFEDLFRSRFGIKHDINSSVDLDGNAITPLSPVDLEMHSKGLFLVTNREFSDSNPEVGTPPLKTSDLLELFFLDDPILSNSNDGDIIQHREQTFFSQPSFAQINFDDIETNQNIPFGVSLTGPNPQYILEEKGELTLDLSLIWNASIYVSPQWLPGKAELRIDGCSRNDAYIGFARVELVVQIAGEEFILESQEDNNAGCDLRVLFFNDSEYFGATGVAPIENLLVNNAPPGSGLGRAFFDGSGIELTNPATSGSLFNHSTTIINKTVEKGDEVAIYLRYFVEGEYRRHGFNNSELGWIVQAAFYNEDLNSPPNTSFLKMSLNSVDEITNSSAYLLHETLDKMLEISTGLNGRLRSTLLGRTALGYAQNGCAAFNTILNGFGIRNFDVVNRPPNTSLEEYLNSIRAIYNIGTGLSTDSGDDVLIVEEAEHFFQDVEIRHVADPSGYRISVDSESIINEIEIGYDTFQEDGINLLDDPNTRRRFTTPITTEKRKLDIISSYISSGYTIELQRREQFNKSPSESLDFDDRIFIVAVLLDGIDWQSERDENFSTINGVFSPETSYNLRLTPKRMLFRWAKFLKGAFKYKNQATESIRFTFGFKNNNLETVTATPACEQTGLIKESDDILLEDFPDSGNGLFSPEIIEFTEQLSWPDFEQIRKALKGESVLADNFGYIRVTDPDGIDQKGWPIEIRYNISTQKATYTLRRKWQ